MPEKLVNFYGYTDLSFIENKRVLQQPLLSKEQVPSLDQTEIVWDDPQFQRYLPYVYWIQQQELTTIYGLTAEALSDYAIDPELLAQFPQFSAVPAVPMRKFLSLQQRLEESA